MKQPSQREMRKPKTNLNPGKRYRCAVCHKRSPKKVKARPLVLSQMSPRHRVNLMVTFLDRLACLVWGHKPFWEFERRHFIPAYFGVHNGPEQEYDPDNIGVFMQCCGRCGVFYVSSVSSVLHKEPWEE